MINIINDTLINHSDEYDIILVGTNCYQVLRNGFQYEISKKYPHVKKENNKTKYGDISKVGTILECKNESSPLIVLLYISFGYNFKGNTNEYIDYNALINCLKLCNLLYQGKKIATTMLGCTFFDGNANKNKVLDILQRTTKNVNIDVYDYEQISHQLHKRKELKDLKRERKTLFFNKEKNDKENHIKQ